ncbi:hypothetical protein [Roseimaritima sediminicola]|uniref:hypothetical protein n=1 Tax=Roseimaritima sediminicola TaxID=2662066 RepID=UPI0012984EF3|nr:hypothetical protein [Roseimaritima sediminicola]
MTRLLFPCLIAAATVACFLLPTSLAAQEAERAAAEPTEQPQRYLITVSEYRLDIDAAQLTAEAIAEAREAEGVAPVEVIMLSTMASAESMVQFGRSMTVTIGHVVSNRNVTARRTEEREVGTLLRLTAEPAGEKVAAKIEFECSRPVGQGSEDAPPDMVTTSFDTTQVFELGEPTLIAASTSGEPSFFFMTIHQR